MLQPPTTTTPAAPDCPVRFLGVLPDGRHDFLDVSGTPVRLTDRELMSRHGLLSLFFGSNRWLLQRFPKQLPVQTTAGEVQRLVDFDIAAASAWIAEVSRRATTQDISP